MDRCITFQMFEPMHKAAAALQLDLAVRWYALGQCYCHIHTGQIRPHRVWDRKFIRFGVTAGPNQGNSFECGQGRPQRIG